MINIAKSDPSNDAHGADASVMPAMRRSPEAKPDLAREHVRGMTNRQIYAHWSTRGNEFVAVASSPGHGLTADQLHTIWLLHWADRHAAGQETLTRITQEQVARDRARFVRNLHRYYDDGNLKALGAEFHAAERDVSTARLMFQQSVDARAFLHSADHAGDQVTLVQLEHQWRYAA
jgi:hypothetical protein